MVQIMQITTHVGNTNVCTASNLLYVGLGEHSKITDWVNVASWPLELRLRLISHMCLITYIAYLNQYACMAWCIKKLKSACAKLYYDLKIPGYYSC